MAKPRFFKNQFIPTWEEYCQKSDAKLPDNSTDDVSIILSQFDKDFVKQATNFISQILTLYANPKQLPPKVSAYDTYKSIYCGIGGICIVLLRIIQIINDYRDTNVNNNKNNNNNNNSNSSDNNSNNNDNIASNEEKKDTDMTESSQSQQTPLQQSNERTQRWNSFVNELITVFKIEINDNSNNSNNNNNSLEMNEIYDLLSNKLLSIIDVYNTSMYDDFDNRKENRQRYSLLEGISGAHAIRCILYYYQKKIDKYNEYLIKLKRLYSKVLELDAYEILYGRMGYVSAFAMIQHFTKQEVLRCAEVARIIDSVIEDGRNEAQAFEIDQQGIPMMWQWRKYYLGGAHGVAGILLTLLLSMPYYTNNNNKNNNNVNNSLYNTLETAVNGCIKFKYKDSFNFRSKLGKNEIDLTAQTEDPQRALVQWCHGVPGFVSMYCESIVRLRLNQTDDKMRDEWIRLAENGVNEVMWPRGLLIKGFGLCHGIAGNGYAFLTLYRMCLNMFNSDKNEDSKDKSDSKDSKNKRMDYLYKSMQFLNFMIDPNLKFPFENDRPFSLFEGCLGGCIFAMDTLFAPETSSFPCFEYNL